MADDERRFRVSCAKCNEVVEARCFDELPKYDCPHCGEDYRIDAVITHDQALHFTQEQLDYLTGPGGIRIEG